MSSPTPVSASSPPVDVILDETCREHDEDDSDPSSPSCGLGCPRRTSSDSHIQHFSAEIEVAGARAGAIVARLIDRPDREFQLHCDETGDMHRVAAALFGGSGAPRFPGLSADPLAAKGGFLYIETFTLDAAHRAGGDTDVALAALAQFLRLPGMPWTAAVYICDGFCLTKEEEKRGWREADTERFRSNLDRSPEDRVDGAPAEILARSAAYKAAQAADAWPFLRAGFEEVVHAKAGGGWLFATRGMTQRQSLSHAAAVAVPLRVEKPDAKATADMQKTREDLALERLVLGGRGEYFEKELLAADVPAFLARVDVLLGKGAELGRADALVKACEAVLPLAVVEGLVQRGADVNRQDPEGRSALMMAAKRTTALLSVRNVFPDGETCRLLLRLGANREVKDNDGRTAYGYFVASRSGVEGMARMPMKFQLSQVAGSAVADEVVARQTATMDKLRAILAEISEMLKPPSGPSPADLQTEEDARSSDSDPSDLDDEMADSPLSRSDMMMMLGSYNHEHSTRISGRPVVSDHRKDCTECGHDFFYGEYYWTDFGSPWGADKFCDGCMAERLGGFFEEGDEDDEDDDDDDF